MTLLINFAAIVMLCAGFAFYNSLKTRKTTNNTESRIAAPVKSYSQKEALATPETYQESNPLLFDSHPEICERLIEHLECDKPYLNPDLKISDIATSIGTNKAYLSKVINNVFDKNFSQLVNWYRIRDAMTFYSSNPNLTITELATKSGFQSMTTFNTSFSRYTGMTPADWCKKYKKELQDGIITNNSTSAAKKPKKASIT